MASKTTINCSIRIGDNWTRLEWKLEGDEWDLLFLYWYVY
jgi:hypothetical protein